MAHEGRLPLGCAPGTSRPAIRDHPWGASTPDAPLPPVRAKRGFAGDGAGAPWHSRDHLQGDPTE